MIELITGVNLINGLGLNANCNDDLVPSLCQAIIDLHVGNPVRLSTDFKMIDHGIGSILDVTTTKGYMKLEIEDVLYEYLVVECPRLDTAKDKLASLGEHIKSFVPDIYKTQVGCALTPAALGSLFNYRGLLLFCFENDYLVQMSTLPGNGYSGNDYYGNNSTLEEYIKQISLYPNNLTQDQRTNIHALLTGPVDTSVNAQNRGGYCTYQSAFELILFVKLGYLRVNGLQIQGLDFSLLLSRERSVGTYKNGLQYGNLMTAIIMPNALATPHFSKPYFGQTLLKMTGGIRESTTKQVFPIIIDKYPGFTDYITITLSDKDEEFLKQINELSSDSIYTKHKTLTSFSDTPTTRGCKVYSNASGTLKVLAREEKKKASDEEAYKNRVFRDYLSHAISMVCIPMFQKEFVIPEYLQKSFEFNMATLTSTYYLPHRHYSSKPRHTDRYDEVFANKLNDPNWVVPMIEADLPVVPHQVKDFVNEFKAMTIASSTQARSSIFTRYFVEPYMEVSVNSYTMINTPAPFGWMYDIDNQMVHNWAYKMASAHLLRSSTPSGRFFANCGLMTDKTFGIKSIMNHVFVKTEFTGLHKNFCATSPDQFVPIEKRAQFTSAINEIYTANFVPNDKVESALASWGREDYGEYKANINQILFIQEDSLTILKSLYKCASFEDLALALEFVMPMCLETVETLDYSPQLKNHVSRMLKYFWDITVAISEELTPDESTD